VAVNPHDGSVNHGVFHVGIAGDRLKYPFENAGFYPISAACEHGIPVAKQRWQIAPRAARPRNPQYRLQEKPIIATRAARVSGLAKAVRLHKPPLLIGENESIHAKLL
jgi:hypothetical protein